MTIGFCLLTFLGALQESSVEAEVTDSLHVEIVVRSQCVLGEAPLWHPAEKRLYWADIDRGRLHRFDPATGEHKIVLEGRPIGGLTCQADGSLLLFRDRGTVEIFRDGEIVRTVLPKIPDEATSRFNDVIADPRGRVFCGTMPTESR
ncbi:MAG: SMP-30/gluconolactonase/LRE family protein, partial [Planctomycetota bacterium]